MKIRTIINYTSTVAAIAGLPLLAPSVKAAPTPLLGQISIHLGNNQPPPPSQYQPSWSDDQRRELRHIYYRLEHANKDYEGHRSDALREIRRAAEQMGMDLHGQGYAREWEGSQGYGGYNQQTESQEWSDNTLRHARERLRELAESTQDPVRHHLFEAVHD